MNRQIQEMQLNHLQKHVPAFVCGIAASLLCIAAAACTPEPSCEESVMPDDQLPNMTVMSYNIGNSDTSDRHYSLRIKKVAYETHMGKKIRAIRPDIVALQEVLSPRVCTSFNETLDENTCYEKTPQARRILGPDYTIVCDQRKHIECVGVHRDFGTIRGVAQGAFVLDGASTLPLPMDPCEYGDCDGDGDECDAESTVSYVIVDTPRGPIQIVHTHPTAIGVKCLQAQVQQTFELASGSNMPSIMLGDWNFDPARTSDVVSSAIWNAHISGTKQFVDHSQVDDMCRPVPTQRNGARSLDRVVSNFAMGSCIVEHSANLDQDFDFPKKVARVDHNAVICDMYDPR